MLYNIYVSDKYMKYIKHVDISLILNYKILNHL